MVSHTLFSINEEHCLGYYPFSFASEGAAWTLTPDILWGKKLNCKVEEQERGGKKEERIVFWSFPGKTDTLFIPRSSPAPGRRRRNATCLYTEICQRYSSWTLPTWLLLHQDEILGGGFPSEQDENKKKQNKTTKKGTEIEYKWRFFLLCELCLMSPISPPENAIWDGVY